MEVSVYMDIIEANTGGRYYGFDMLGFYPGRGVGRPFKDGEYWLEVEDDISVFPVAHLLQRAFDLDAMVVYKRPDRLSDRLLQASRQDTLMNAIVYVKMRKDGDKETTRLGSYRFQFWVNRMLPNQGDDQGRKWEVLELFLADKTEKIMGLSK